MGGERRRAAKVIVGSEKNVDHRRGSGVMYPKNATSPERLAIGPVVQIADGAVQTSGVAVKVMPQGGAATAGAGTVSYVEGVVHYVPTQAETNYSSFTLVAYKAGCIPAAATVVTTATSTAGQVVVAANNDKSGYALSTAAVTAIEAALLNEGDGQQLIDAIVQAIDAADIENATLPALIRDAILDRVLAGNHDTANTLGKVLQDVLADAASAKTVTDKVDGMLELDGATYRYTQNSLEQGPGGAASEGARTITITVNDGVVPLENANVRYTSGGVTCTGATNVNGQLVLNVDDATYTVAITRNGYSFAGTTHAVTADGSVAYSLTAVSITPADDPAYTNAYLTVFDEDGDVKAGVVFTYRLTSAPSGSGGSYEPTSNNATSGVDGVVTMPMYKGATYQVGRQGGTIQTVTIPDGAGASYALPNMM